MAEHPIIFSTEMVRAILDGRKTQTRRIIKPQPEYENGYRYWWKGDWDTRGGPRAGVCTHGTPGNGEATWPLKEIVEHCPYGQVGDRLWVREGLSLWPGTVAIYLADDEQMPSPMNQEHQEWLNNYKNHTVPSIHMPHWAARIFLEVIGLRVERVQDITAADIEAEGIDISIDGISTANHFRGDCWELWKKLWDSINAKRGYSWDKNPWVWCISYQRTDK